MSRKIKTIKSLHATNTFVACIITVLFNSCESKGGLERLGFSDVLHVELKDCDFDNENLSNPEMMFANDTSLTLLDLHRNKLFSAYSLADGQLKTRFGEIGHGENEILVGTIGYLHDDSFVTYDMQTNRIAKYNPWEGDSSYKRVHCAIPDDAEVSRLMLVNDSTLVLMGCYKNRYKYVKISNDAILDSAVLVANPDDKELDKSHRFLSEQVEVAVHPYGKNLLPRPIILTISTLSALLIAGWT